MFIDLFQVHKLQAKGWHSVLLCYRESGKKVTLKQKMFQHQKLEKKFKNKTVFQDSRAWQGYSTRVSKAVNSNFSYVYEYIQIQCLNKSIFFKKHLRPLSPGVSGDQRNRAKQMMPPPTTPPGLPIAGRLMPRASCLACYIFQGIWLACVT